MRFRYKADHGVGPHMISKIGYFHFGKDHDRPVETLASELNRLRNEAGHALLVLPEMIDVMADYAGGEWRKYDLDFKTRLQRLCRGFNLVMIAGLRVPVGVGEGKYYNGAVLLTGQNMEELHRKNGVDGGDYINYNGLLNTNPASLDNVTVGTVICMDVDAPFCRWGDGQGDKNLFNRFQSRTVGHHGIKIIGIPANMSRASGFNMIGGKALSNPVWRGHFVILANSHADGHPSYIAKPDLQVVSTTASETNRVVLYHLTEERVIE
jgi:predicted amidohydrolase